MGNKLISKGKLFWKQEWSDRNCKLCQTGTWINVYRAWFEKLFYRLAPELWRMWNNRSRKVRWGKFEKYINPDLKN